MSTEYSPEELKLAVKVIYERDYSVLDPNIKRALRLLAHCYYDKDDDIITTEFKEICSTYPIWYMFYTHRVLMNLRLAYDITLPVGKIRAILLTQETLDLIEIIKNMPLN